MSLRKRTSTAAFLLILVFLLIQFASRVLFFLIIQAIILAALLEFYNLARKRKLHPQTVLGVVMTFVLAFSFFLPVKFPLSLALFLCFILMAFYYLIFINTLEKLALFPASIAVTFFGAVYLGFTLNHFHLLRVEKGPYPIYFLLSVIFIGDTGAYLIGKTLGRHKMTPLASPRKTWEGSFGGIVFACLAAVAVQKLLLPQVSTNKAVICAALVHALAQVSDPLESLFKRAVGVKDSSNFLPGHGGFLDRIDSLIMAGPAFYYLIAILWT